ncbi:MAG: hypothetical protein JWM11_4857 [Planctomycetaceae bacterium]|nr:hypothetical protein [Planctomycetaceae bacterium]
MPGNEDHNPFEFDAESGWCQTLKFQEFEAYDAAASREFEDRQRALNASDDEDDDPKEDLLFEEGLFLVTAESWDEEIPPTAAQIRAYSWLIKQRSTVFRVLIDHAYQYYNEHIDEFRDFFNGEPADRDLLLPRLTSPKDLKRLMRLISIEIDEKTRDGQALITFSFDATWDFNEYWDVTLCGDQITTLDSAPFPFTLPRDSGWEKLPVSRQGLRFAEFLYRDQWTGTFTIDAQGVCTRQIWCPVCNGAELADPELITAHREPATSHMLATLVHKLELQTWIRRGLTLVAPACFLLGWSWNPGFYWAAIAVSLIAGLAAFLDAGWRGGLWVWLAAIEFVLANLARLPARQNPRFDEIPDWTWLGLFETFVWLSSAAMAGAWMFLLLGAFRHPILRPAYGNLVAFGLIEIAAVSFVAMTDYSALHLLWFTPLALVLTIITGFWTIRRSLKRAARQAFEGSGMTGGVEDAWRQILSKMEQGSGQTKDTVFESRPRPNQDRLNENK